MKLVINCKPYQSQETTILEALGERRPPPSGAGACAKTRFNLAFRLYQPERHKDLISPPPKFR